MNAKQIGLSILLADFLGFTAYAVYAYGFVGLFALVFANAATTLAMVDLTIALTMVAVWMWQDARNRGISPIPYLLITAVSGSAGPLLYLIRTSAGNATRPIGATARSLA
jgi:Terpene cyclase DEP1